jgi:photosystem II stability/assembly factor-like uncharacterized protein
LKAISRYRWSLFLLVSFFLVPYHLPAAQKLTGLTGTLRGLHAVDKKVIWVSGTKGEFAVTTDGGKTWTTSAVPGAERLDFRDVQGFSADEALLMSIGPGKASKIFYTSDGGKSWKLTFENQDSLAFFDGMDFFDRNHGLIISDPADSKPYILETRDGGITWKRLQPSKVPDLNKGEYSFAASGTSLDAIPGGMCFLATGGAAARVFKSTDFGTTWSAALLPVIQVDPASGAFSVAKGPGNRVAVCGGHYQRITQTGANIALSDDGGKSWKIPEGSREVPFMECIRWKNRKILIACGPPGVWVSTDGGQNWKEALKDGFHTFDISGNRLIFAGNRGDVRIFELADLLKLADNQSSR